MKIIMHFYERNIVEIKSEYTNFLSNILTPLIYEGLRSLYESAKEAELKYLEKMKSDANIKNPGILKLFQKTLIGLKELNNNKIEAEANRIKEKSRCSEWFDDLIKAVIKSNIILLTYNTTEKHCSIVKEKYHDSVSSKDFIHKCYLSCARQFYNYPELFYDKYENPLMLKRNQREILEIIKISIPEAIRKMLPMKIILTEYLKNDYLVEDYGDMGNIPKAQYSNMKALVARDLDDEMNGFKEVIEPEETFNIDENFKLLQERARKAKISAEPEPAIISQSNIKSEPDNRSRSDTNESRNSRTESTNTESLSESDLSDIRNKLQNVSSLLDNNSIVETDKDLLSRPPKIRMTKQQKIDDFYDEAGKNSKYYSDLMNV